MFDFIVEIIKLMIWKLVGWITYLYNKNGDYKHTSGTRISNSQFVDSRFVKAVAAENLYYQY